MKHEKLITPVELADQLGVTVAWLYQHTYSGSSDRLPFFKVGRLLRFKPSEVERWLKRRSEEDA